MFRVIHSHQLISPNSIGTNLRKFNKYQILSIPSQFASTHSFNEFTFKSSLNASSEALNSPSNLLFYNSSRKYATSVVPKNNNKLPHEQEVSEEELRTISQDIQRSQDPEKNYSKVRQSTNAIEKHPSIDLLVSRAKAYMNLRMYNNAKKDYEQAASLAKQNKQFEKEKVYLEEAKNVDQMYSRDDFPIHWFQENVVYDEILNNAILINRSWKDTWKWESDLEVGKTIKYNSLHLKSSGNISASKWWKKSIDDASPKQIDENSREDFPLNHVPWLFDIFRTLSFVRPELLTMCLSSGISGSGYGIYTTQFFNGNKWEVVVIDDEIPLLKNMPRLKRSEEEYDYWPLLMEKALAKYFGSYRAIRELKYKNPAYMIEILTCLTGGSFVRYQHDSRFLDYMYTQLHDFEKEQAIMFAYTQESWRLTTGEYQNGLKKGSVPYLISKVYSIRMPNGEEKKFVRLRNPHFHDGISKVWTGRYNYNDRESWTEYLKRELEYDTILESEFVMEYESFLEHFRYTDVVHFNDILRQWKKENIGEFNIDPKVPAQFQLTMPKKSGNFYLDVNQLSDKVYPIRLVVYDSHKKKIESGKYLEISDSSDYDIIAEDSVWRKNRSTSIGLYLKPSDSPKTIKVIIDSPKSVPVQIILKTDNKLAKVIKVEDKKLSFFEKFEIDMYLILFFTVAISFFAYIFWGVKNLKQKKIEEAERLAKLKQAAQSLSKAREERK